MFLCPLAVCHRAELLQHSGTFDPALRCCDDFDLFLRISLHCRFEPIGQPVGVRRRHENNMSQRSGATQRAQAEVLRRFVEGHGGDRFLDSQRVAQRLSQLYHRSARCFLREGRYRQAHAMARESQSFQINLKNWLARFMSYTLQPLEHTDAE